MVLTGAWPFLTSIIGIKIIDFVLLLMNSGRETVMLLLEEETTWLTTTLERKLKSFILDCLYAKSKNQMSSEAHEVMVTSALVHIQNTQMKQLLHNPCVQEHDQSTLNLSACFQWVCLGLQRWEAGGLHVSSNGCTVLKDASWAHRNTTFMSSHPHEEHDNHPRVWNSPFEGKMAWRPIHPTKSV